MISLAGLVVVLSSLWILFVCLEKENPSIKAEMPSLSMAIGPSKNLLISVSDEKKRIAQDIDSNSKRWERQYSC